MNGARAGRRLLWAHSGEVAALMRHRCAGMNKTRMKREARGEPVVELEERERGAVDFAGARLDWIGFVNHATASTAAATALTTARDARRAPAGETFVETYLQPFGPSPSMTFMAIP